MKSISKARRAVDIFSASGALLAVACSSSSTDPQAGAPNGPAAQVVGESTQTFGTNVVHCVPTGELAWSMAVYDATGSDLLSLSFRVEDGQATLAWTDTADAPPHVAKLGAVPDTSAISCGTLTTLSNTVYQSRATIEADVAATASRPYDRWGCDYVDSSTMQSIEAFLNIQEGIPAPDTADCDGWGACCDAHDMCYAQNGDCPGESWYHTLLCVVTLNIGNCYTACDYCNLGALSCFYGSAPGPSSCCNAAPNGAGNCNVCGQTRNQYQWTGCVANCQCPNGTSCNTSNGNCNDPCPNNPYGSCPENQLWDPAQCQCVECQNLQCPSGNWSVIDPSTGLNSGNPYYCQCVCTPPQSVIDDCTASGGTFDPTQCSCNTSTISFCTGCEWTCEQYGVAANQCYADTGYQCDSEGCCLQDTGCGDSSGGGYGGGGGCDYYCADYGVQEGQCDQGWECEDDGCLYDYGCTS